MPGLLIRQQIVDNLDLPVFDIPEAVSAADIILAPDNKKQFTTLPLTPELPREVIGHPRHWFALIPSDEVEAGLTQVDFGFSSAKFTGYDATETRFSHELFIDNEIRLSHESSPLVKALFQHIGGTVVKSVRNSEDKIFASLEVQYGIHEDNILQWGQLTYSKKLLSAGNLLKQVMEEPYDEYPRVFRNAILPRYRNKTAGFLAMSALAVCRDIDLV